MGSINGYAAHAAGAELLPYKYSPGTLKPNDVEIQISHCGICHSDIHLINNDWGISEFPFIPGHEIVGKITALGSEVTTLSIGQRVGLGWQSNSCGVCEWCLQGKENLCAASQGTASTEMAAMLMRFAPTPASSSRSRKSWRAKTPLRCSAAASRFTTPSAPTE